ncbi:MAG TPA: hypothetical protein IAC19_04885 [Candidatus Ventricola gallistercoris]|nr:hypothetical protein [Candidatus Ventricola gallistercoris]
MKRNKKAILAAGLLSGAAALTGCTANTTPVTTPTPQPAQQETVAPPTAEPAAQASTAPTDQMEAGGEETPGPIRLRVDGQEADISAIEEQDMLLLPLMETAALLEWKASSESLEEEAKTKRTITLEKEESKITVTWISSDNTASQITWQRDGLLIPVDPYITTMDDVVYVPVSFFEEAMDVSVQQGQDAVDLQTKAPADTPQTSEQNE